MFFGIIAAIFALVGLIMSIPLILTYMDIGQVPRFPTAILITGLGILAALNIFAGLTLDTVVRGRREMRRLAYLSHRAPGGVDRRT